MFCTKCGKEIPDNSNFCVFCQADLRENTEAAEEQSEQVITEPDYTYTPEAAVENGDKSAFTTSLIAIILAGIGWFISLFYIIPFVSYVALVLLIPAIVLAVLGLSKASKAKKINNTGKAKTALILSIIAIILAGLSLVCCVSCGACVTCAICNGAESFNEYSGEIDFNDIFNQLSQIG